MQKASCVIMVGLPGTGKSTLAAKIMNHFTEIWYASTDDYIEKVAAENGKTYNDVFATTIKVATIKMNEIVERAVTYREDIMFDQTNLSKKKRAMIMQKVRDYDSKLCVVILPPTSDKDFVEWKRRLGSRPGKVIPPHILDSMVNNFEFPTVDEGFSVMVYDIYGNLIES